MTEDEAHRYIQKRSMELRISKLELAERILKSYKKNQLILLEKSHIMET